MPATVALMDTGSFSLELDPATPGQVLDDISIKKRLWATYVNTPHHWEIGELSDVDLLSMARYCGVLLSQGPNRRSIEGPGLAFWLGGDGDGGALYVGNDVKPTASLSLAAHLAVVLPANGVTLGTVTASATAFTRNVEGGDTDREIIDTLCRMAPGGPYFWDLDPTTFELNVGAAADLWPSHTAPTVLLADSNGREAGGITGFAAALDVEAIDGSEVRTDVYVDFDDDTTHHGLSSPTLPATYGDLDSGSPDHYAYIDWSPKRPKPATEKWRKVAAWGITAQNRANSLAAAEANERAQIRPEITASLDVDDPWSYDLGPGDKVWVDDPDNDLVDTTNQVPFRGEVRFPTTGRVEEMTAPLVGGHYLRCWDGASGFEWIDLSRYALGEEGPVELKINHRDRFPVRARPRKLTRRQRRAWHRDAKDAMLFDRFVNGGR